MKILVTGALGHIGSAFIHSLEDDEFSDVFMIDNMLTQRYSSLFNLPKKTKFHFFEDDILNADLNKFISKVDIVLHLAAITDAASSFEKHEDVEKVNHQGTKKIAEACIINQTPLIFPSTTSVYGTQSNIVDEFCSIDELKPQSPYAKYKLFSEEMLKNMKKEDGLDFVACRFGTIFGTSIGMRFHTAVNRFCWQAVMKQPLTVWETAMDQKRPYLGVDDAVRSIKFIIKNKIFDGEVYNIVSSNNTVRDIIDIIRISIPDLDIKLVDSKIMNQLSYEVLADKINKVGFSPNSLINNGIKQTIDYLQ